VNDVRADVSESGPERHAVTVALDEPLAVTRREDFEKRIFFLSPHIVDFRTEVHDGSIRHVDLSLDEPVEAAELRRLLSKLARQVGLLADAAGDERVWAARRHCDDFYDAYLQLRNRGLAIPTGEGLVALGKPIFQLVDALDQLLVSLVHDRFRADEVRYPTLIPAATLARAGYMSSFPHHLMFAARLRNDDSTYEEFRTRLDRDGLDGALMRHYGGEVEYCLPPTMCYHVYQQLRGSTIDAETGVVVTTVGKSFRFESHYATSLERLWDFTVREVVFIGTKDFALACRAELMDAVYGLVDDLGLAGICVVANDPFFMDSSRDAAARIDMQKSFELKYELRLPIARDTDLAGGSFNYHYDMLGRAFDLRLTTGRRASTACAGFGLERLALAFLSQHGLDASRWPAAVTELLPSSYALS